MSATCLKFGLRNLKALKKYSGSVIFFHKTAYIEILFFDFVSEQKIKIEIFECWRQTAPFLTEEDASRTLFECQDCDKHVMLMIQH